MSRSIIFTQEMIDNAFSLFMRSVRGVRMGDSMKPFVFEDSQKNKKTKLHFSESAWVKMKALVHTFTGEIAWRGIVHRKGDEYVVDDIIVYPQIVSSAYVDTDFEEHRDWFEQLPDDIINNMRLHGHSHVMMGVVPSSVDKALYKQIIDELDDDMFYVFLIVNKKNDMFVEIYDMQKNIVYEKSDIAVVVDYDPEIVSFLDKAKKIVKDKRDLGSSVKKVLDKDYDIESLII